MSKKIKISTLIIVALLAISLVLMSTCSSHKDQKQGQQNVTTETAIVLGNQPETPQNPWGRTKTENGFKYSNVPGDFCFIFVGSIMSSNFNKNDEISFDVNGKLISKTDPQYLQSLTSQCLSETNVIVIEKK